MGIIYSVDIDSQGSLKTDEIWSERLHISLGDPLRSLWLMKFQLNYTFSFAKGMYVFIVLLHCIVSIQVRHTAPSVTLVGIIP